MPKINQVEYVVLKEAQEEGYKWIARDSFNSLVFVYEMIPTKSDHYWKRSPNGRSWHIDSDLFQFIQWEDKKPRNITELINQQ